MKHRFVLATLAAIAAATPAAAQQVVTSGGLPPHEILTIVRSAGLDPLGQPVRRGIHYALRAIGDGDREVSVLVDARSGGIVSITPSATASRLPPRGGSLDRGAVPVEPGMAPGVTYGPYERMPPGYIPPEPPGVYQAGPPVVYQGQPGMYRVGPPVVYDDEPTIIYGTRPPADIPGVPSTVRRGPPPVITATPSDEIASAEPDVVTPGRAGALPPPPDRFPQRLPPATAAKPKPDKKTVSAMPKQAPLPKPRPADASAAEPRSGVDAVPPLVPEKKPDVSAVPN